MNKGKYTRFIAVALAGTTLAGTAAFISLTSTPAPRYSPRTPDQAPAQGIEGALKYYMMLRANPKTGQFDYEEMLKAREAVMAFSGSKTAALNLQWQEVGPDNIGGRTRAVLIDKDNSSKIYAGSVSGGLWYSTSGAGSWIQHPDISTNLAVSAITQAANGDIYVGTGEGQYGNWGTGSGGILGGGVWKSTNGGANFTLVPGTTPTPNSTGVEWSTVNEMAADPFNANRIYAATQRGLKATDDGGVTWFNPIYIGTSTIKDTKEAQDVDVASDGTVICNVGGAIHISATGNDNSFTNLTTKVPSTGLPNSAGRIEIAFSPTDPNYIYASAGSSSGTLYNVYRSTDKGNTFTSIVIDNNGPVGSNTAFEPFQGQAGYDNAIAVFPDNKNKIILGGVQLWAWELGVGWLRIGSEAKSAFNRYYVHADKHDFKFDLKNPSILYIGSDGGVAKSTDGARTFKPMNKGYNVTQYYSVDATPSGEYVGGGAQDNGSTMMNTMNIMEGFNTLMNARDLTGGDGAYIEFTAFSPDAVLTTSQYGNLRRSATGAKGGAFAAFFETRITALADKISGVGQPGFGPFVSPIRLWEGYWGKSLSAKDDNNPCQVISYDGSALYDTCQKITLGARYDTCLAVALGVVDAIKLSPPTQTQHNDGRAGIWITRGALDFSTTPAWYNIASLTVSSYSSGEADVTDMEFTGDGDVLFVGTSDGRLYRISNIRAARMMRTADVSGDSVVIVTKQVRTFSKPVTSVAVNQGDPNHVVVTLGGYDSSTDYIYESTNALDTATVLTTTIQGNLPLMPVYHAVIDRFNGNRVIIGTEYGVYASDNGGASWSEENTGLAKVPTFMLRIQDRDENGNFSSRLYAGTHGRGIFTSGTMVGVDAEITRDKAAPVSDIVLFPNPMRDGTGNIAFTLDDAAMVEAVVYDMNGRIVWMRDPAHMRAGSHRVTFYGNELSAGTYIVTLKVNGRNHPSKLLVTK